MLARLFEAYLPGLFAGYFFVAMVVAFVVAGAAGLAVEWLLIRHLYTRPLDTLLATWGLSLIMQQAFRSIFGAREVGVELPEWMMGSLNVTDTIEVPINGLFVMGLTLVITRRRGPPDVPVALGSAGARRGANRTMSGAVGINTRRVDRLTFGLGCGIAGVAGARLHHDRFDRPDRGSLYIVDTFLVVVFGGAQSLLGPIASALDDRPSAIDARILPDGSMAKVLTLLIVIGILMLRPQGLFVLKVRR